MSLGHLRAVAYAGRIGELLGSDFVDGMSVALSTSAVETILPVELLRPACAASTALASLTPDGAAFVSQISSLLEAAVEEMEESVVIACLVQALGRLGAAAEPQLPRILGLMEYRSPSVRAAACASLGTLGAVADSTEIAQALARRLKDSHPSVREAAAVAFGCMPREGPQHSDDIAALFKDRVYKVQCAAVRALANFGDRGQMYASEISRMMIRSDGPVRIAAAEVLSGMGSRGAAFAGEVAQLLTDPDCYVRRAGIEGLDRIGGQALTTYGTQIAALQSDPLETVRVAAKASLAALRDA